MRRRARWAAAALITFGAVLTGAAYAAGGPAGASTTAPHSFTPLSAAQNARLPHTTLPHLRPMASGNNSSAFVSGNWAGYATAACSTCALRYVYSQWTVPSINCAASPDGYVVHWVGLDGLFNSDPTVQQTGTGAICAGTTPSYYVWWETFPGNSIQAYTGVSPGDSITANVYFNGSRYQMSATDTTNGNVLAETVPCGAASCKNATAEVITEAPGNSEGVLPLADFSVANYTSSLVTSRAGLHGTLATLPGYWTSDSITQENSSGGVLDATSNLQGGQAFFSSWRASS